MKKNIFKSLMLAAVVSTVGIGSVYAANENSEYEVQPKNASDYKLEINSKYGTDVGNSAILYISGLNPSQRGSISGNYYLKYVNKDTAKPAEVSVSNLDKDLKFESYQPLSETKDGKYIVEHQTQAYLNNQDLYAYIYNCTKTVDYARYCSVTTATPIKVEKEKMPELGQRYKSTFFDGTYDSEPHVSIFPLYPTIGLDDSTKKIKLNVKVGIIDDSSVIKAMALKESGAKEKLYNYAKNATNGKTFSGDLDNFYKVPFTGVKIEEGKYYYIFSDIEDPEKKYIDVSDVSIAMGTDYGVLTNEVKYGDYENVEYKDYEYGCYACTNDYVWTVKGYQASTCKLVDSITSKGNCVKSVKTGVEDYLVPGALVITIGGAIIALLKKKTHFRKI